MTRLVLASVVIPAHDEESVVNDLLDDLRGSGVALEVVVVANACSDGTARVAREHGSRWSQGTVTVAEIDVPSKIAALNEGDRRASVFPRLYIDADVRIPADTLRALIEVLVSAPEPLIATPRVSVRLDRAAVLVRAYYRIWMRTDYVRRGHIGSGIYGVNEHGRRRWADFPDVIADDRFAQLQFAPDERAAAPGEPFSVPAPRTLRSLIRRGWRIQAGNRQLSELAPELGMSDDVVARGDGAARLLAGCLRRPSLWPALVVYCGSYAAIRIGASVVGRRAEISWLRDESSRRVGFGS